MADAVLQFTDEQQTSFNRYYELLVDWNERVNLTSITERQEVFTKHFLDSLLVQTLSEWNALPAGAQVVDVGTGGGFPGMPLAIMYKQYHFVLCDALQKRVNFLNHVVAELGLQNVTVVHGRAEDLARVADYRQRFDACVSRAVARLNVLVELTMPFLRVGGFLFAYKGPSVADELDDGRRALGKIGGQLVRLDRSELPDGQGSRALVLARQVAATPGKYPRKAGTPQKNPL